MDLLRDLKGAELRRSETFSYADAMHPVGEDGAEDRSIEFSFSSETPVARWFGDEVLSHDSGAVDLQRLNDGAPVLFNHDPNRPIGVVERAWVDGEKRRGVARVRFSRNSFADEVFGDVQDGILRNISVGYTISEVDTTRDGIVVATSWQAHEVSVVSVPADASVGIGRSLDSDNAVDKAVLPHHSKTPSMEETINIEEVRAQAAADERTRVASITAMCREHNVDLAQPLIERGVSEADAMREVLAEIGKRAKQPATPAASAATPISGQSADIGLSAREAKEFSFVRAINALSNPGDRRAQDAAAFEREVSSAVEQRTGRTAQGILVPNEVLRRDLTVGTGSAAGDLVFTDARPGSFIELLRNRMALSAVGVQTLSGLMGNVAIPRQTGAPTAYWVAEKGSPTESNPTVDQINMTPKTVGAYTDFSRKLMLQSSIDVETMVRNELATVLALEIDRVGLYGLGNTNQPLGLKLTTGINTVNLGAAAPTYAELVQMETEIAADNADIGAMAYISNATIYGGLKTTEKAANTAQFVLEPGGTVNGYPIVRSNQVASGDVWFGVWSNLILGLWSGLDLTVDPYANATSGGVRVIALQDLDYGCRHPECFVRANDSL
jgi:HK97 family phage major capsid protein/HK97 family phage prohead protease